MTDRESRERLLELIIKCDKDDEVLVCFNERPRKTQASEIIADHLIANGVVVLPCRKGTVLNRNGEKCIANHWNIVLTAFNEDNHVRLFDIEEAEKALAERSEGK